MAGRDMKVNLIANTSQFKSAMSESSNQIKLINSEFKSAAAETDKYGNRLDSTGAKQKQLSGVIEQYRLRVKAIKDEQRHWTNELKKGNVTEEQHAQKQKELARRLNNTEAEMKKYEGQLKRINAEGKATRRTYADFDKQFRDVGRTMRNVGAQVGITAGVGFMAMKRVLGDVVGEAKDYQAQMSEVKAISGATGDQMEKLTKQSKDLGRQTKFTAQEAAESQANLARAGFKTNEILDAMPGLLDLAASSNMELGTAANITSNIIRGFNKDAKESGHIADVLAKGAATANTDVEGLGKAMEVAAPVANSLDIAFESVAASAGLMADAGIDGSKSGRMLRQGMLRLSKPTGEAADLIEELGINTFDADGNMKSLDGVVAELEKGLKGQSKQAKAAALATIFGSESTAGWTVLLEKGSGALKDYTTDLENSDGAAKEMADTMMDNAEGAIVRMQSALSGLKIELGEKLLPILGEAADWIGDLANKMSEMDEETVTTIAQAGLLVTAVLGVTTVVAGLVTGIGALMAFAGPVGLAIVGGTALLAGLAAVIYKNQVRTEKLKEEQAKAKQEALNYGENLREGTRKGVQGYTDLYEGAKIKMVELKKMSGDEAAKTVQEIQSAFKEMASIAIAELEKQKDELTRAVNEIYGTVGEAGKSTMDEVTNNVIEKFDKDIAEYKRARDTVNKIIEEYGGNWQDYPPKVQEAYNEAYAIMDQGAKVFAGTQREMQAIQERITEQGSAIQNKQAGEFIQKINDTYNKSLDSIRDYYNEKRDIFDQGLAQEKITYGEHENLMKGLEAATTSMYNDAAKAQSDARNDLAGHLDKRGELLDLATGKELERIKVEQNINTERGIIQIDRAETDEEYFDRWFKLQEDTLGYSKEFADKTNKVAWDQQIEFLESMGYTKDEAIIISQDLVNAANAELKKGNEEAKEAGKSKGDAYKLGLDDSKPGNTKSAKEIIEAQKEELKKGDAEAYKYGKAKGNHHKLGLDDTVSSNKTAAQNFSKATDDGLKEGKDSAKKHGKDKGNAHNKGFGDTKGLNVRTAIDIRNSLINEIEKGDPESKAAGKSKGTAHESGLNSTKGSNSTAANLLSIGVTEKLASTTDGGGGKKAGSSFWSGIRNQSGNTSSAARYLASRGESGLRSVKTAGAGAAFVSGFRNSIGSGSVWRTAWNLGKSALSALRQSIDSHSPSKETEKLGDNFGDGFNFAISDKTKEAIKKSKEMGQRTTKALSDEINKYKQDFAKLSVGIEQNKRALTVEHTLDNRFNEMIRAVKHKDENKPIKDLLEATLQQNQILMQLLAKDNTAVVGFESIYQPIKKRLNEDKYSNHQSRRGR